MGFSRKFKYLMDPWIRGVEEGEGEENLVGMYFMTQDNVHH
jgi:hypothetical protein